MKRSVLVVSQALDGWKLFDEGCAVFWFLEKETALEVAKTIAKTRNFYSDRPTAVDLDAAQQPRERVATYG